MDNLISSVRARLDAGERAVLCAVLETDGSVPREAGARMAVFADGTALGTVGGGAVEHLAAEHALQLLREDRSETKRYDLYPNPGEDIGMVCGGNVLLGFACLGAAHAAAIADWEAVSDAACNAWLRTCFADGRAELAVLREDLHGEERLPERPVLTREDGCISLLEPIATRCTVYVFGCGHVSAALVPALAAVGFPVTVYDARPELAVPERFPQARRVLCGPFEEILSRVQIAPEDYIVVMTPGHKADYTVLRQALVTDASYVGCIGSKRKVACVNEQLRADGFSEAQIARIHAPIGLPILAETPEEIAVSITAQLIYHRHGGR